MLARASAALLLALCPLLAGCHHKSCCQPEQRNYPPAACCPQPVVARAPVIQAYSPQQPACPNAFAR